MTIFVCDVEMFARYFNRESGSSRCSITSAQITTSTSSNEPDGSPEEKSSEIQWPKLRFCLRNEQPLLGQRQRFAVQGMLYVYR